MAPSTHGDQVKRALTDNNAFRVITVDATATVRGAIVAQKVTGGVARMFAELLVGAILVRETMSPDLRVQVILQSGDGVLPTWRMIADAQPDGLTRGLVQLKNRPETEAFSLGEAPVFKSRARSTMARFIRGVVEAAEAGGISGALMAYMQASEQVASMIAVGVHMENGEIAKAGGYIVQLLPELEEGPLAIATERLHHFDSIEKLLASGGAEPAVLMSELLYGMPYAEVGSGPVHFGCNCNRERILATLATLPRADVQELLASGAPVEMTCDYCGTDYAVEPAVLQGLIDPN